MLFSKSFGYALRGLLYVAVMQGEKDRIQLNEIAQELDVPRHFMGKILKRMAKESLLDSSRGTNGGFSINQKTLSVSLLSIVEITDGLSTFKNCVLRLHECDRQNPCPMHPKVEDIKNSLQDWLASTTVQDLILNDSHDFIKSITTNHLPEKDKYITH
jgi:Rrf2 family protein